MGGEKPGRPKTLVRRHILEIKGDTREWLDEKIDQVLEVARLKILAEPVAATLGNPVAFPLLIGLGGSLMAIIYLKWRFPDPLAQSESIVRDVARAIADFLERAKPDPPIGERDPDTLDRLIAAYADFLMRIWKDPLFGFGGGGPFIPGEGVLP